MTRRTSTSDQAQTSYVLILLSDARDPSLIRPGDLVVAGVYRLLQRVGDSPFETAAPNCTEQDADQNPATRQTTSSRPRFRLSSRPTSPPNAGLGAAGRSRCAVRAASVRL